jgi:hypothetical protein
MFEHLNQQLYINPSMFGKCCVNFQETTTAFIIIIQDKEL